MFKGFVQEARLNLDRSLEPTAEPEPELEQPAWLTSLVHVNSRLVVRHVVSMRCSRNHPPHVLAWKIRCGGSISYPT